MSSYSHSIRLNKDKCYGCTVCIKKCPTEAIRIRGGLVDRIDKKCIDCGNCVRSCPNKSTYCDSSTLSDLANFKYNIAIVSPVLYGQFDDLSDINIALDAVKSLGFDFVFEGAIGAQVYAKQAKEYIEKTNMPVISSSCPAVVRLIQLYYHDLIDYIIPIKTPEEIAAIMARKEFLKNNNVNEKDVGVFLISPCTAMMANIKNPIGFKTSAIDGVIPIISVFSKIKKYISSIEDLPKAKSVANKFGIGWSIVSGQRKALNQKQVLVVDGIENVTTALEQFENDRFEELTFFEGVACPSGCVGGALAFENVYVTRNRLENFMREIDNPDVAQNVCDKFDFLQDVEEHEVMVLDTNMGEALKKLRQTQAIKKELPGLDCGACGCPTCRALAEDIVMGEASEFDCIFMMRTKLNIANRNEKDEMEQE